MQAARPTGRNGNCDTEGMSHAPADLSHECPSARPSTVQSRALHLACKILGSARHLADYLEASDEELLAWLEARVELPHDLFIKVVAVILAQWEPRENVMAAARKH